MLHEQVPVPDLSVPPPLHLRELSDDALMDRTARRESAAFDVLYARHIVSARAASFRVVHDAQRADDVCQDAFLAVWRSAARYDPALGNARSWVLSIVRNRAIDALRTSSRIRSSEVTDDALTWRLPAPSCDGTEFTALRNGEARATRALLDLLDPDQRRVVELAFFGGYSHSEIATMLGLPLGTVKARVCRGLLRMRRGVEPVG